MEVISSSGRTPLSGTPPHGATPARTPLSHLAALAGTPPSTTPKERTSGQVVSRLNQQLEERCKILQASSDPCKLKLLSPELPSPFRYMVETMDHKLSCLRWRLHNWQKAFEAHLPSGVTCVPIDVITQDDMFVVGHIVCDAEGGRLNAASTMLEGLTADCGAARVHLDLSQVPVFQLFPGQVVAARGFNLDGTKFIVRQLYMHLPKPLPSTPPSAALQGSNRWSMVVASGPFTSTDNQDYKPLRDLLNYCHRTSPSALLLLGPLLDERHPQLPQLDITVQELAETVEKQLGDWAEAHPGCRLALMSSTRDVHHHPVFPTPPYTIKQGLAGKAILLQNPCVFQCNDVVMGASSTDVLLHLSGEVAQVGAHPDRLASITGQLLGQHRFYPLFPPAIGTCLDTSFHSHLEMPLSPHILFLPSELNPFAKSVPLTQTLPDAPPPAGNVVCINPGRLVKGTSPGTFATVTVLPCAAEAADNAVAERCLVEIVNV